MKHNNTTKITILLAVLIVGAMSGCIEHTTQTEEGTVTYDVIDLTVTTEIEEGTVTHGIIDQTTTLDVDYYEDGMHITGTMTQKHNDDPYYDLSMNMDFYEDGLHITGKATYAGYDIDDTDNWDMNCIVDGYKDGMHITGTMTRVCGSEMYVNCNINGYVEGYPVTGTMVGYESRVYVTVTVHTPYGDVTETTVTAT